MSTEKKTAQRPTRLLYAMGRAETASCEAGTAGCCVDHGRCDHDCETW